MGSIMVEQVAHTPEPWKYGKLDDDNFGISAGWTDIATVHNRDDRAEDEANARRIVACVNACAGLSTEKLEEGIGTLAEFLLEWCIEEESR